MDKGRPITAEGLLKGAIVGGDAVIAFDQLPNHRFTLFNREIVGGVLIVGHFDYLIADVGGGGGGYGADGIAGHDGGGVDARLRIGVGDGRACAMIAIAKVPGIGNLGAIGNRGTKVRGVA